MFLWYADESGNRDPRIKIPQKNGPDKDGDWIYVLCAVSLLDYKWHGFEKSLNRHKRFLLKRVQQKSGMRLELSDTEIKSNWIRLPAERAKRPFLAHISDDEREDLVDDFYDQLGFHNMNVVAVVIDKRHLHSYMDQEKIHRKAWELLLEQIQRIMSARNRKHQAMVVYDDVGKQMNCSLAMKHAYIMEEGTASGKWLRNICEMPMFVRSELSNGVQLADLCAYNIYRAFKSNNLSYDFFQKIEKAIWMKSTPNSHPFSGIRIFPAESPLLKVVDQWEKQRAPAFGRGSAKMVSSGANPIEPTSGTGQNVLQPYSNISGTQAQGPVIPPALPSDPADGTPGD